MAKVLFYTATAEQFNSLDYKDDNALYFITDTGELYKGSVRYSFPVKEVVEFPYPGESGVIYVGSSGETKIWAGGNYIAIGGSQVDNYISDAVHHEVSGDEAGTGIYAGMDAGDTGILFTMNAGNQIFVRLPDLADTYIADNGYSRGVSVTVDDFRISAEVNLSQTEDNQARLENDGIYVAPLEWQNL